MTRLKFLLRRASAYWQTLVTLSLGVILATAFLASGPLLINTVMDFGLRRTLLNATGFTNTLRLTSRESPNSDLHETLDKEVRRLLQERFTDHLTEIVSSARIGLLYPWQDNRIIPNERITLWFYGASQEELSEHVRFIGGSWSDRIRPEPNVISVLVGRSFADDFDLGIGERLPVSLNPREIEAGLWLEVAGIVIQEDLRDPYLSGETTPLRPYRANAEAVNYSIILPRDRFFALADEFFPSLRAEYRWQTNLAPEQLSFEDIAGWQTSLHTLELDLLQIDKDLRVETSPGELLDTFATQANAVRAPLYFLIGIVVLVALYYLVMVAALSLERMAREISVIRSRGAASRWIGQLQFLEAAIISGAAVLSGPLLAWLVVRGLAAYGPMALVAGGSWSLTIPQASWLAAIIGATACISSLLIPLPWTLKNTVVTHHQHVTRSSSTPWWQRAYLDVFVLVVGLILLLRLRSAGSIIGDVAETGQVDVLLLVTPLILLLGAAAILLRIFPVLLQGGVQLVSRGKGLPAVLAFWQASRQPRHITRLVLLLMLAMALGFVSSSLNAAFDRNERERSQYLVGGDARVMIGAASKEGDALAQTEALTGSAAAGATATVWRTEAALYFGTTFPRLSLLAIDPEKFNQVAQYRSDFARRPLAQMTAEMVGDWEVNKFAVPGQLLPGIPAHIGVWYSLPFSLRKDPDRFELLNGITIEARAQSAQGEKISVVMRFVESAGEPIEGWDYFGGDIPELDQSSYPIYLQSMWINSQHFSPGEREALWFDDITVVDSRTNAVTIIDDFEDRHKFSWHELTAPIRAGPVGINPRSGTTSMAITVGTSSMSRVRWYGVSQIVDSPLQPIPALVSPAFLARTELKSGDLVRLSVRLFGVTDWSEVTFKILDGVDFFPTMYETEEAGFMVTLLDPLLDQINLHRYLPMQGNELLVDLALTDQDQITTTTLGLPEDQVLSAASVLQNLKAHPLALGLRSVTLFGYLLTTVLSLVGFGSHFYLVTRQRVTDYGVLRALGLSARQLYGALLLEQLLLILSGLILGTILGILLDELIVTGLPLQLGEGTAAPPFVNQTDWTAVARIYFTLIVSFLLSLAVATLFLWRQQIHRVLRVGEE